MTDKQRLNALRRAKANLKQTTRGYKDDARGLYWERAMKYIDKVMADLEPAPAPNIGPVWKGGKSLLDHDLTHPTSGILLYPAFDDAFVPNREIIAPENLTVTLDSSSRPGDAFYATGASGLKYWFGHLAKAPAKGKHFKKGEVMGRVLDHNVGGGPHVHVGVNAEKFLGKGKELQHHKNYTHGAPTIRKQLGW